MNSNSERDAWRELAGEMVDYVRETLVNLNDLKGYPRYDREIKNAKQIISRYEALEQEAKEN
jgi:hypothetical protein